MVVPARQSSPAVSSICVGVVPLPGRFYTSPPALPLYGRRTFSTDGESYDGHTMSIADCRSYGPRLPVNTLRSATERLAIVGVEPVRRHVDPGARESVGQPHGPKRAAATGHPGAGRQPATTRLKYGLRHPPAPALPKAAVPCPAIKVRCGASTTFVPTRPALKASLGPNRRWSTGSCGRPVTRHGTPSRWAS